MKGILKIHEFFIEGRNQDRSHVLLHISETPSYGEESQGYFLHLPK